MFMISHQLFFNEFALEYILFDYFTQFCGRTHQPEEADFFYLPLIRDLDYRIALTGKGDRKPSPVDQALLDVLEKDNFNRWNEVFNITDIYWKKKKGADHLIVMPAPVTNFRHETNRRGFFHYMPQLAPPIFFNVELSRSFLNEYPVCARSKNIVLPYAMTDANHYTGELYGKYKRDKLIFYQGGMHGSCIYVRMALNSLIRSEWSVQRGDRKREEGFQMATFCPIPIGDSPSSKRMYDALHYGCIPVLLSDEAVWAFSPQATIYSPAIANKTEGLSAWKTVDPHLFSLTLPQSLVYSSASYLLRHQADLLPLLNIHPEVMVILEELAKEEENERKQDLQSASATVYPLDTMNDTQSNLALSNEQMKQKYDMKSFQRALSQVPVAKNTLIRLLQRLPKGFIQSLQHRLQEVRPLYEFYQSSNAYQSGEALTARHVFPSGGAIRAIDTILETRRKEGIDAIAQRCEEERGASGHNYLASYPCHH
eukprot:gene5407-5947_t